MAEPSASAKLLQRYRESVQADLKVLQNARHVLLDHVDGAKSTIQNVAKSLLDASVAYGFHEIARAAAALEESTDQNRAERLDALLLLLDEIVNTGREPRCARVLLVGRLESERRVLQSLPAEPGSEIFVTDTALQAEEAVLKHRFALAVVFLNLPDLDGRHFVERMLRNPRATDLPIVVVAPGRGPHLEDELLSLGASAVFVRPLDVARFAETIAELLSSEDDSAERPLSRRREALTGLLTRHAFSVSFQRATTLARSADLPVWFVLIRVNDVQGLTHVHGPRILEAILKGASGTLRTMLPEADLVARWSTDEFTALLLNRRRDELPGILERLVRALDAQRYPAGGGRHVSVSFAAAVVQVGGDMSLRDTSLRANRLIANGRVLGPERVYLEDEQTGPPRRTALLALADNLVPAVVRHHLEEEGFVVIHKTTLPDALSAAHELDMVDLVLADADLPAESGIPIVRVLRAVDNLAEAPLVLIVKRDDDAALAEGFRFGTTDYLSKPFSATELLARIHYVLKKRDSSPRSTDPPPHIGSSPLLDALAQVTRLRLSAGESVDIPELGVLRVEYRSSHLREDASGRRVLIPPHNTVRLSSGRKP